jgi:hypothetical protein
MSDQDLKTEDNADKATVVEPLFTIGDRNFSKDDAVNKITNADSFIEQLKAEGKTKDDELVQLRAQIDQSTKLDDALARMNSQGASETPSQDASTNAIDIEALKKELLGTMSESLSQKEKDGVSQKNQEDSISAAQAVYGDAYESKLREKAKQLGMSDKDIISEASANPAKFKALFGLNKTNQSNPSPSFGNNGSRTETEATVLKLGGFSTTDRVNNLKETFTSFAKKHGVDPESMFKF